MPPASRLAPRDATEREFVDSLSAEDRARLQVEQAASSSGVDFILCGEMGRHVVELKAQVNAARELHAAILALAMYIARSDDRGWLLIRQTKLTQARLEHEWQAVRSTLRPDVAQRLWVAALTNSGAWRSDPSQRFGVVEDWIMRVGQGPVASDAVAPSRVHVAVPTPKFFDIWKVLVAAWLRSEGPLAVNTIETRAGASHPTVAEALRRLEHHKELRRRSDRAVDLRHWPHRTFAQLEPHLHSLRKTHWFADASGRKPDPDFLLARLRKTGPDHVAVGGVVAARRLDPELDLLGLPRLDLSLHAPLGTAPDLGFVRRLDPALQQVESEVGAALAVHIVTRPWSGFESEGTAAAWADPAEIVLDLAELRLEAQLKQFVDLLGVKS